MAEPDRSVRVRLAADPDGGPSEAGTLTIKGPARGAVRDEWEYPIPAPDARAMLETVCGARLVEKTRHEVPAGDRVFEIDEFHGAHRGLVIAEVELDEEGQEPPRPEWLGEEVTHDPRFLNASLATRPWREGDGEEDEAGSVERPSPR